MATRSEAWQSKTAEEWCVCTPSHRAARYEAFAELFRNVGAHPQDAIRLLLSTPCSWAPARAMRGIDLQAEGLSILGSPADDVFMQRYEREYCRLFGEGRFDPFENVLSPSETTYMVADPDALCSRLREFYARAGFVRQATDIIACDPSHISTELQFMAHCLRKVSEGDPGAAHDAREFFCRHLGEWAHLFSVVVADQAHNPAIRFAGQALESFLCCEKDRFYAMAGHA